ncbi:MAG: hypothetical protein A2527_06485 [Candidatus Lambdaproteobacteria bacterium RIFOXYD2_FULL_50_16]|uniref:DNA polymerase IV n=1 Tax=Candidatus Lambdaproteobacteria bacterium RIFOXYD2_FULL_50_16 TaxID=1817772 RepID=A0A1F6GA42_9PROT|nr:MAG: hypothetical protein A2527_06485 [Candidatus Lambdaproteobacteria bacterium RIFOXYD2_FULL_50_16]
MPDLPMVGFKKIIHLDMDAFYASVEVKDRPELRGKPVIVGGDPNSRAVVAAANYEARRFGVHSAMSCSKAKRLCPQAVFLPPRLERYKEISRAIHLIFCQYTDLIEPLALDEAWLDVTQNKLGLPSATWVATHIKWDIENQLGLTSSAGVSYNKFLAKIASGMDKPNGLMVITPEEAADFLARLRLKELPGVGRVMEKRLADLGLEYGHQLLKVSQEDLIRHFGKYGRQLFHLIRGIDEREVVTHRERKSIGIEHTFGADAQWGPNLERALDILLRGLFKRAKSGERRGRALTLKVKFEDFTQVTKSYSGAEPLTQAKIRRIALEKLAQVEAVYPNKLVRLLGLSMSGFQGKASNKDPNFQLNLFEAILGGTLEAEVGLEQRNPLLNFRLVQEITGGQFIVDPKNLEKPLIGGAFDSRRINGENIFFALNLGGGDGHAYLANLASTSIKLAVVEREVALPEGIAGILVPNSLKAMQALARWLARQFKGKLISLTGSSGKTTAKAWFTHFLEGHYQVQSNPGSFNNHIGCPATVLGLKPNTEVLILEMGTNGPGELDLLSSIAPADLTLLLNVGHAHLGKFGNAQALLEAKLEIFNHLRPGGQKLVPAADLRIISRLGKDFIGFGPGSNTKGEVLAVDGLLGEQSILLKHPGGELRITVPHLGDYVPSLLSAIWAATQALGLNIPDFAERAQSLPQEKGRATLLEGMKGERVLDDTYNANPESLVMMLNTLTKLNGDRFVGVVGNLAEMDQGLSESRKVIIAGLPRNLTHLFLTGETGGVLALAVKEARPSMQVRYFPKLPDLMAALETLRGPGCIIGVKGSRTSHMERVVMALTEREFACVLDRCHILQHCRECPKLWG